jgi:hypothetical protein
MNGRRPSGHRIRPIASSSHFLFIIPRRADEKKMDKGKSKQKVTRETCEGGNADDAAFSDVMLIL